VADDTDDKKTEDKKTEDKTAQKRSDVEDDRFGVELGVDSTMPFSTPFRPVQLGISKTPKEELQEVLHDESEEWGPTVRQLVAMRRMDGQARALYRLITLPIRAALTQATFVPAEDGDAEAEFIDQVFNTAPENGGMTVTFHRFMSQMLQGLFDGFAAFEKVFWIPEDGPLAGKTTLKKLGHRPSNTVTFVADKKGGFAGLRQRSVEAGKVIDVYIEPEYCFYYAAQEEERKFYGVSFFQSAFYHYDKKVKMYFTAHVAAQRAAVGTRIGTFPAGASKAARADFAAQLRNMALAQWMAMPEGYKVESLKEAGQVDFLAQINHHDSQMSKSILANFFDKDQGAGNNEGSLVNFASPGDSMFLLMLRAIMDDIAAQINHYIIPQLIDLNFDGGKYPTFSWGNLTDEQKAAISTTFDKLAAAGQSLTITPEFMRELEKKVADEMGLEINWEEVDAREAEEKAANDALLAAQGMAPPLQPGLDPAADDAAALDFQNQLAGVAAAPVGAIPPGGAPVAPGAAVPPKPKPKDKVALSRQDEDLFVLAQGLLDTARDSIGLSRTVKTDEGAVRYGKPIGTTITTKGGRSLEARPVTIERLQSLQRQIAAAKRLGDEGLLRQRLREFNRDVGQWSANRDPLEIAALMRKDEATAEAEEVPAKEPDTEPAA